MTEKKTTMKLRVELKEGQNPRTYDIETGEDLSDRVRKIQIRSLRRADAVLYKKRDDGMCPYFDKDTQDAAIAIVPVDRIEGTWVANKEPLYVPCGRGMDNFDLSTARKALIRLQARTCPNFGGGKNGGIVSFETCDEGLRRELLNDIVEALFPGEEGEALHRQMSEQIEQKKA